MSKREIDSDTPCGSKDATVDDCEGDNVVTLDDVIQYQNDLEEDARAVLGASDASNCSYDQVNVFTYSVLLDACKYPLKSKRIFL